MEKGVNNGNRVVGIDIVKVLAVLLVLNSHIKICYENFDFLATGGIW